jgi:hypothetical protein
VKYLIMIHSNARFQERWEALTDAQREDFGRGHFRLGDELAASGELVASEGLGDPGLGRRVTRAEGRTTATGPGGPGGDGPFAETKEHLAGFYLVDVADEDRAIAIAGQVPDAVWGLVEVRPVLDMSGWDLDG